MAEIDSMGIAFLTLRRRSKNVMAALRERPGADWRRIRLSNASCRYRTPRIIDEIIRIPKYPREIRQLAIADLGRDDPILLVTNQMKTPPADLVDRYARRMIVENQIAESIDFFHMDALSAAVPMRVNVDLQLTLMASGLYRMMAHRIGNGHATATPKTLFRNFIEASAAITIVGQDIRVRFANRAHNTLMIRAGFGERPTVLPWLVGRAVTLDFCG